MKNIPGENTLPPVPGPFPNPHDPSWRIRQIEERLRVVEEYLSRTNFTPYSQGPMYAPPVNYKE